MRTFRRKVSPRATARPTSSPGCATDRRVSTRGVLSSQRTTPQAKGQDGFAQVTSSMEWWLSEVVAVIQGARRRRVSERPVLGSARLMRKRECGTSLASTASRTVALSWRPTESPDSVPGSARDTQRMGWRLSLGKDVNTPDASAEPEPMILQVERDGFVQRTNSLEWSTSSIQSVTNPTVESLRPMESRVGSPRDALVIAPRGCCHALVRDVWSVENPPYMAPCSSLVIVKLTRKTQRTT